MFLLEKQIPLPLFFITLVWRLGACVYRAIQKRIESPSEKGWNINHSYLNADLPSLSYPLALQEDTPKVYPKDIGWLA